MAACQHRGEDFLHARDRNVREEAEPALVDPDERHIERRQAPRDREHRAVATEDNRNVGVRPEIRCRRRREIRPSASSVPCRPRSPRRGRGRRETKRDATAAPRCRGSRGARSAPPGGNGRRAPAGRRSIPSPGLKHTRRRGHSRPMHDPDADDHRASPGVTGASLAVK